MVHHAGRDDLDVAVRCDLFDPETLLPAFVAYVCKEFSVRRDCRYLCFTVACQSLDLELRGCGSRRVVTAEKTVDTIRHEAKPIEHEPGPGHPNEHDGGDEDNN